MTQGITPALKHLIHQLSYLPGIGPKSAQRIAFHMLSKAKPQSLQLSQAIQEAIESIQHCEKCRHFCQGPQCTICHSTQRNQKQICIVEQPQDLLAIEQMGHYQGLYFVLMGYLSPIDGIGPEQLALDQLMQRLRQEPIEEMILATNTTVEGEATSQYICDLAASHQVTVSRLAHGIPMGGELEYLDSHTVSHAFNARRRMSQLTLHNHE